jgi:hypothetical protein
MSRNLGALTLLDPSGPAWPVMGVLYLFYLRLYKFQDNINKNPLHKSKKRNSGRLI